MEHIVTQNKFFMFEILFHQIIRYLTYNFGLNYNRTFDLKRIVN